MKLPRRYRQWVFVKPMANDVLGLEQFAPAGNYRSRN